MALFGQMLLNHGTLNGQQILQPSSVATLFTPQFTPAPGVNPWDLGFYEMNRNGLRFIGHGGDLLACHSQFWVEPTRGLTFFISYNSAGAANVAREEIFRALVDRYLPSPPNHPPYLKLSAKDLAPYTGFYHTSRRADSTKTRLLDALSPRKVGATKEGDLTISTLKDFHGALVHLHPIGNDSFYDEDGQFTLHFERDASGNVIGYATPGHSDRVPFAERPPVFFSLAGFSLVTLLLACIAPLVRTFRRIFLRSRPAIAPQPGTIWLTRPLQLAALACLANVAYLGVILAHTAEVTNFYQIGHLEPYFIIQNILTVIALLAILAGVISGIGALRRQLRLITRLKFALVTLACLYIAWSFFYFHFIGSAHLY